MTHYTNTSNPVDFPKTESKMNERILELALQAGMNTVEFNPGGNKLVFYGVDLGADGRFEKFAKLIIQDCISQIAMIGVSNCDDDDVVWTVDKSIGNIRTHFGIEK